MIDQYPSPNGVLTSLIWRKTAAGGETSLSGYDNASQALSYTPGQEQVYLNGILLVRGDDYTATNGTSITGLAALTVNDFIQINCYNNFSLATLPATSLTGTVANNQLQNSSITINGSAVSLGGSTTILSGSAQDNEPTSPTEGQLWLDTNGTLATTGFTEKATLTTTGDIYYASGASTPARLGIGSTSQVLAVSGGVPAWTAPGGLTLISATSASAISSLVFNNLGSYKQLILIWAGIRHNAASNQFSIRLNNDSGTNYDISYHGYVAGVEVLMMYDGNALGNSGAHSMSAFGTGTSDTTSYHDCVGQIVIDNPISTTKNKSFKGMFAYYDVQNGGRTIMDFTGQYKSTSAITSIDIVRTAGSSTFSNQGNSEIRLYGVN